MSSSGRNNSLPKNIRVRARMIGQLTDSTQSTLANFLRGVGDPYALETVFRYAHAHESWAHVWPSLVPVLYEAAIYEGDRRRVLQAWVIIRCVALSGSVSTNPHSLWACAWPFLKSAIEARGTVAAAVAEDSQAILVFCAAAIARFAEVDSMCKTIASTPDVIPVLGLVWREAAKKKNEREPVAGVAMVGMMQVMPCLTMDVDAEEVFAGLASAVGDSAEALGAFARDCIRSANVAGERDATVAPSAIISAVGFWRNVLRAIYKTSECSGRDLEDALATNGTRAVLATSMGLLVRHELDGDGHCRGALGETIAMIASLKTKPNNMGTWAEAVEGGMLHSAYRTLELYHDDALGGIINYLVCTAIGCTLAHPRVSKAVADAQPAATRFEHQLGTEGVWFAAKAARRGAQVSTARRDRTMLCETCYCVGNREGMKRCGACKDALYCGTACQKQAWAKHVVACGQRLENPAMPRVIQTDRFLVLNWTGFWPKPSARR
uniref:MYND-type domain-containing protein n=1 Tax=Mycena chlorophos TaxID=658473 RepID=A0ABQ0LH46_MYCCL|nr:predicted protein [Mycena chlorophos]